LLAISQKFVCIRLVTYEDKVESEFLAQLGTYRAGGVANTGFALLAPDGKTKLAKAGRSARQAFPGREDHTIQGLVAAMERIAEKYPGNGKSIAQRPVPYLKDLRRALNVASCDNQPLVIVSMTSEAQRRRVEKALAPLAWHEDFRGRFAFAFTNKAAERKPIKDAPEQAAVFVVQPGAYGLEGSVIANATTLDAKHLRAMLTSGLVKYEALDKSVAQNRAGIAAGKTWKSESIELRPRDLNGGNRQRGGR